MDFSCNEYDKISKETLEKEKLFLEILELKQPFYKKTAFIASVATITIAILTFLSALLSGFFSTKMEALEVKVSKLQEQELDLIAQNSNLKTQLKGLLKEKSEIDKEMKEIFSLAEKIERNTKTVKPEMDMFELTIWVQSLNRLANKILKEKPNKANSADTKAPAVD